MTAKERRAVAEVAEVLIDLFSLNYQVLVGGEDHARAQIRKLDAAVKVLTAATPKGGAKP